ncbi:MAG: radical SAM/SPASM domain-containing protein [Nitrospirota bacterium]|jgi:MoaA/NifB/PqqE/SkfB family radical SAM enzyme
MIETAWKRLSTDSLDFLLKSRTLRNIALRGARKSLHRKYVVVNKDNRPRAMQEGRCQILMNLMHAVHRALSDGRISPKVRKALIANFVGCVVLGTNERTVEFSRTYGFDPPAFLNISPTKKCNLFCTGCYASSSKESAETLDFEVFDWIIKQKTQLWGSHFTVISGGEPLLYRRGERTFFDILEANSDNYFMIYTNSTLITREAARRMADLGNVTPAISVEGFEEETDTRRGKGTYGKIMRAMDNLVGAGVPFGISATATRLNVDTIMSERFRDFYFGERGAVYGWIFQYMPIGRSYTLDLMITPEQRVALYKQEQRMIRESNIFLVDFWNGGPFSTGCISAGRPGGYFYIDWNGNAAPCTFFPYYASNVNDVYREGGSLNDILLSPYFASLRKWQNEYGYDQPPDKVKNFIVPCPIRDHYEDARSIIDGFDVKPMDEQAGEALTDEEYSRRMAAYGRDVRALTEDIWVRDFIAPECARAEKAMRTGHGRPEGGKAPGVV